jgi:hypothetical protein
LNRKIKQLSRHLTVKALKTKLETIYGAVEKYVKVKRDSRAEFDEKPLLKRYGVPEVCSQEELIENEEFFENELLADSEYVEIQEHAAEETRSNNGHRDIESSEIDYTEIPYVETSAVESEEEQIIHEDVIVELFNEDNDDLDDEDIAMEEMLMYNLAINSYKIPDDDQQVTTSTTPEGIYKINISQIFFCFSSGPLGTTQVRRYC